MEKSKMFIVCGLGFGDEGKGTITDFLVRLHKIPLVVRYTGGPQAGHNVVEPDGRWHCFSQFGSGTLVPGTKTFISKEMLVEPGNLLREDLALKEKGINDALTRLVIDPDAAIVTPLHRMISRMKETSRGKNKFGSCGMGVGEAVYDREEGNGITFRDVLFGESYLRRKLMALLSGKFDEAQKILKSCPAEEQYETFKCFQDEEIDIGELAKLYLKTVFETEITMDRDGNYLEKALMQDIPMVFEGAQGALLDRLYGFYPYITKTRATFHNAEKLLGTRIQEDSLKQKYDIEKIGVIRAYMTRHGTGPFVTEDNNLNKHFRDSYNPENTWQGKVRVGWLDIMAVRYGIKINDGIDYIALTNLDQLSKLETIKVCVSYEYSGDLNLLPPYFIWEKDGRNSAKIFAIRKPKTSLFGKDELAKILSCCRPLHFREFQGWQCDISKAKTFDELPHQAREYVKFLSGKRGLKTPIKIISVNPTSDGKILID